MDSFNTLEFTQESGEIVSETTEYDINDKLSIDLPIPTLEDIDHPFVPEVNQEYKIREINGKEDLKLLSFVINDPDYFAMIEGEAGVGKNMAIKAIAEATNWPMIRVNFSVGTTYQSLVGRYAPVDNGDTEEDTFSRAEVIDNVANRLESQGIPDTAYSVAESAIPSGSSFRWVDGLLTHAVKNGWMFVADEINAAEDEAIMPLNGLTEDRDSRYLTIEEKSEVIEPHPRFRFVATRNPISYSGVSEMNSALESRAYVIPFDYHDDLAIEEILMRRTDIIENSSEKSMQALVDLAQDIRKQEQSGNSIMTKVSTRDLIKVGRLTEIMSIEDATKTVFSGIADPTDKQSIKEMIRTQNF